MAMVFAMLLTGCSDTVSADPSGGLYLSEVVASNSDSLKDPVYGTPDWIELCNSTDAPSTSKTIRYMNLTGTGIPFLRRR